MLSLKRVTFKNSQSDSLDCLINSVKKDWTALDQMYPMKYYSAILFVIYSGY